ncbi:MAG: Short-chain dehydrogenase/reductase [candidate division NC10 bacterium]|nr:Short-chain dehydrogenase/reductase [candidate division NC10 bacterium]
MDIEGKVALVTGAAKRVGRSIALALAERGAELVVHYRTSDREAQEVLALAKKLGGKPAAVRADLSVPAEVGTMVDSALRAFGRVDILVNSAAIFYRTPFPTLTEADWDRFLAVNLKAPFLLCRQAGEIMCKQGYGKIVNVADIAGTKVWADFIPYSVSKAGLLALTTGLAKALAPAVQVNAICPGTVLLPDGSAPDEQARAVERVPLRRLGAPEDIARAAVYLVESDFVTGEVLTVDGGQRLL